jgi:hypothetical protein
MRNRLMGVVAGIALTTAVVTLAAPQAMAAVYTTKTIYKTQTADNGCSGPALKPSAGTFGTVNYREYGPQPEGPFIAATVNLRHAKASHNYTAYLFSTTHDGVAPNSKCGGNITPSKNFTTNASGNATVIMAPAHSDADPFSGLDSDDNVRFMWIEVLDGGIATFSTARVPVYQVNDAG